MIRLPRTVYVASEPINLHLSFDRLAGLVRQALGGDPCADVLYVFHNRRRTHVKLLWHDRSGYWVFYKRLLCGEPHKRRYATRDVMRGPMM